MKKSTLGAAGGIFFGLLGCVGVYISSRESRKREQDLREQIAQLSSSVANRPAPLPDHTEVASLRRDVDGLKARPLVAPPAAGVARPAQGEAGMPAPRGRAMFDPMAQRFENQQRVNAIGERLDERLSHEAVDAVWAPKSLASIKTVFADLPGHRLTSSDCRLDLCRVAVEHDSAEAQHELARKITTRAPFDQDVMFRYDFDSTPPKTILYVAREGVSMHTLVDGDASQSPTAGK